MKKCPYCAEEIQSEAVKCRYCGEWLEAKSAPADSDKQLSDQEKLYWQNLEEKIHSQLECQQGEPGGGKPTPEAPPQQSETAPFDQTTAHDIEVKDQDPSQAHAAPTAPQHAESHPPTPHRKAAAKEKRIDWFLEVMINKYAVFTGRASRREYWTFFLYNFIIMALLSFPSGFTSNAELTKSIGFAAIIVLLYWLVTLIPSTAVAARRLHDTNRSAWWLLTGLILPLSIVAMSATNTGWWLLAPLAVNLLLFVFTVQDSDADDNQYGPNPKPLTANRPTSFSSLAIIVVCLFVVDVIVIYTARATQEKTAAQREQAAPMRAETVYQAHGGNAWAPKGETPFSGQTAGNTATEQADGEAYLIALDAFVSNWRVINKDPKFVAWLREYDPGSVHTRHQLLLDAFSRRDAYETIQYFNRYKAEASKKSAQLTIALYCPHCGKKLQGEGFRACPFCGVSLPKKFWRLGDA